MEQFFSNANSSVIKYAFSIIIFLHGAIHLMGFVKGFSLYDIENLPDTISRTQGVLWFVAFVLFALSGTGFFYDRSFWTFTAVAGLVLSSVLIAGMWHEARFGMIPNLVILVVAVHSLTACSMQKIANRETSMILTPVTIPGDDIISQDDLKVLPEPVSRWLMTTGITGKPPIRVARCEQSALLRMKPGQKEWYTAQALQYSTTENPSFIWTVKMKISPLISIEGRDKFVDGKGEMLIRMNSVLNVVNEKGSMLDEGTLQRFLGELVWLPSLALSPYITWEEIDRHSALATMSYMGTTGSGVFHFSEDGEFVKFVAMRYMGNEPGSQRYPWIITADAYSVFDGIRVPSRMEATWKLDEGDWTWLKLEVSDIKYNTF